MMTLIDIENDSYNVHKLWHKIVYLDYAKSA